MPKRVRVNGVIYNVPENASMDQIQEYVTSKGAKPPEHTAHGASSDFYPGMDVAQRAQIEHPYLTAPVTGLAKLGKGAVDAASAIAGTPGAVYHALTDPLTEKEKADPTYSDFGSSLTNPLRRLFLEPQFEQLDKAKAATNPVEAGARAVASAVPVVGPFAAHLGERAFGGDPLGAAGEAMGFYLAGKGTEAVKDVNIGELRQKAADTLIRRADVNREPLPPASLPTWGSRAAIYATGQALGHPAIGEALVGADFARRWQPYRNLKADVMESTARKLDVRKRPMGKVERATAAADEASRIRQATSRDLANYSRTTFDAPSTETFTSKPPTHIDAPIKEPIDAMRAIEEKIAPSGRNAKKTSQMVNTQGQPTQFGKDLLQQVPELAEAAKGSAADGALMGGYYRTLQNVMEAEDSIDPRRPIDTTAIVSQLGTLAAEYLEKDLPKTADAIEKIQKDWASRTDMTWGEFIKRKRAFFQERNLSSSPMRRAYGILMEESGRVSPQLQEANRAYSTVRRALDNAQIDPNTGRRILEVGKTSKTPARQMQERRPLGQTQIKSEPVKTRAEAIERLRPEGEGPEQDIVPPGGAPTQMARPESTTLGKVGGGIRGEASSLTQTVDSRMRMIQEIAESGATETTGKFIGREGRESGSANYGTEEGRRAGSSFLQHFPELESLGRTPSVIAKAIRQGKGPLYTQIREIVKDAMQDELQSLSGTGRGPGALRERALGVMRQRLQAP